MILWLAVLWAVFGALMGSRAAVALLVSVLFSQFMDAQPFTAWAWVAVDLLVMAVIIRKNMSLRDEVICWAFPVCWCLYLYPDPIRHNGTYMLVIAQLIIAGPWPKFQRSHGAYSHGSIKGPAGAIHDRGR